MRITKSWLLDLKRKAKELEMPPPDRFKPIIFDPKWTASEIAAFSAEGREPLKINMIRVNHERP